MELIFYLKTLLCPQVGRIFFTLYLFHFLSLFFVPANFVASLFLPFFPGTVLVLSQLTSCYASCYCVLVFVVVLLFVVVIASLAVAVPGVPVCLAPRQLPTQAVRSGLMSQ